MAIPNCMKVRIQYIFVKRLWCDTKCGGLIIPIIILHALSVVCISISPLSHTHMHSVISYRAVQLHICQITFHMAACYDTDILSLLRSSLLIFCSSKYVKEHKRSWKLVVTQWQCLGMWHDLTGISVSCVV